MDIVYGGNAKEVRVRPFATFCHRIYLLLTGQLTFYDRDINKLMKL